MDANHAALILLVIGIVILLLLRGRRRGTGSTRTWTFTIGRPPTTQFDLSKLGNQVGPGETPNIVISEPSLLSGSSPTQFHAETPGLALGALQAKESFGQKVLEQLLLPKSLQQDVEVQKLFQEGFAFLQQKNFDQAILLFRKAVKLAHHNLYLPNANETVQGKVAAMAHHNLATALLAKGDLDAAIIEFREGLRLAPEMAALHDALGNALFAKGDRDSAAGEFCEAARLDPNLATLHNNFGQSLAAGGDLDGAVNEYRKALNLNSNLAVAQENLRAAQEKKSGGTMG
jgi:tetratricopeptide (TPR) repeat protein